MRPWLNCLLEGTARLSEIPEQAGHDLQALSRGRCQQVLVRRMLRARGVGVRHPKGRQMQIVREDVVGDGPAQVREDHRRLPGAGADARCRGGLCRRRGEAGARPWRWRGWHRSRAWRCRTPSPGLRGCSTQRAVAPGTSLAGPNRRRWPGHRAARRAAARARCPTPTEVPLAGAAMAW